MSLWKLQVKSFRWVQIAISTLTICLAPNSLAQEAQPQLAFEVASVKPAPPGALPSQSGLMMPSNHTPLPRGLLRMTSQVSVLIFFAEGLDDFTEYMRLTSSLPTWTQQRLFTITARISGEPTREQLQQMMRTLLVERFALRDHEETHDGPVVRLVQVKVGKLGPFLKPHPDGVTCDSDATRRTQAPVPGKAPVCGMNMYRTDDRLLHIVFNNVTLDEAAKMLGGVSSQMGGRNSVKMMDGTGLSGSWDMALDFQVDSGGSLEDENSAGGPTFTGALEKQLGLKLEKGTGPVRTLVVDHIAPPTPD